jgi:hypothetical protein
MFLNSRRNERRVPATSEQRSHQYQQIIPCESGTDPEDPLHILKKHNSV